MRFVHFRLVGPAVACIVLLIIGMATFPYYGVAQIDDEARQRQEELVERNIALWIADVEFSLTAWTVWDEAIAKLDNSFDFEWTDRNIGASLIGTSRTRFTAVLDSGDAVLYSRTDDSVKDRPFFARGAAVITADASQLVAEVRAKEQAPVKNGIPDAIVSSRIEVRGEEAVLLSASLFQADFGTAKPRGSRAPILITAMPISGTLQDFFGSRFLLDDARISPLSMVAPGRARAEVAVGPAGEIEVLSWRPPTPAADVLYQVMPLILTVIVLLVVGGVFMVRISQATAQMLVSREKQMRHAATHDFLTGLANRALLDAEFTEQAAAGELVVVCLDLDGFKAINDTHGHAIGDELLKVVASRLVSSKRDADRLFRLGGDEFAILMPDISAMEADAACRRISALLSKPMSIAGCTVAIGASFGLTRVANPETGCDAVLKAADRALYEAKSLGRGSIVDAATMSARLAEQNVKPKFAARG
ncbi:diguanylate cyclase [Rhizobium sp. S152]|uniref:diguanylate cyclase domain-containing protein n=1 Tax=Rhizobium sp. S152 TaxID=3055038 RepID=UPI0025A9C0FB|nr:diguanylate cyclase [Rhizobium sp. S152]MDM9628699.1 diguanylate cyclase [Rhizobium sp. S152]